MWCGVGGVWCVVCVVWWEDRISHFCHNASNEKQVWDLRLHKQSQSSQILELLHQALLRTGTMYLIREEKISGKYAIFLGCATWWHTTLLSQNKQEWEWREKQRLVTAELKKEKQNKQTKIFCKILLKYPLQKKDEL